jgi:hypothetical protein
VPAAAERAHHGDARALVCAQLEAGAAPWGYAGVRHQGAPSGEGVRVAGEASGAGSGAASRLADEGRGHGRLGAVRPCDRTAVGREQLIRLALEPVDALVERLDVRRQPRTPRAATCSATTCSRKARQGVRLVSIVGER